MKIIKHVCLFFILVCTLTSCAPEPIEKPPTVDTVIVYVTNTGKKYHREQCRYLRKSSIPIPRGEAIDDNYKPCSVCNPDFNPENVLEKEETIEELYQP